MLLLEFHNKIIEDFLLERIGCGTYENVEITIADFDGVVFHLTTASEQKTILTVSVSLKCYPQLKPHGVEELLKQQYGSLLVAPENGYDVSLQLNLENTADKEKVARNVALLKRHCLAAPFYKVFNAIENKQNLGGLIEVNYRDDESFYIKPEVDRAIIIFSILFRDKDDVVLAKAFLQEYQDARRTMTSVPAVTYSQKEPPLELKGAKNVKVGDNYGYVSFVLFQNHVLGKKKDVSADTVMTFRNYLHYHIKCSKAYLHTRMRNRVRAFLQVLNRAKSDQGTGEKKTMSGRTFRRADDPQQETQEFNI